VRGAISDGRPYRDSYPETGFEEINSDVPEDDFWTIFRGGVLADRLLARIS
jgi:hypothetical protein